MNVSTMAAALHRKIGTSSGDGMLTPDVARDLLDEANTILEAEQDWWWRFTQVTFSTVAGQGEYQPAEYAPAGDHLRTLELKAVGEQPIELRTHVDLDYLDPDGVLGQPAIYAYYGDTLILSPTPSGIIEIRHRYLRDVPILANDETEPLMPRMFRWAIVQQAAALAHSRTGDDARAQLADVQVDRWRRRMLDDQRKASGPLRVRVRPGSAI